MPFTKPWNESSPQGTDLANTLDTIIQDLKIAIRERLDVEHKFNPDGSGDMTHRQVTINDVSTGSDRYALRVRNDAVGVYFRIIPSCIINGIQGTALAFNAKWDGVNWTKDNDSYVASAFLFSSTSTYIFAKPVQAAAWIAVWMDQDESNPEFFVGEVVRLQLASGQVSDVDYLPVAIGYPAYQKARVKVVIGMRYNCEVSLVDLDTGNVLDIKPLTHVNPSQLVWQTTVLEATYTTAGTKVLTLRVKNTSTTNSDFWVFVQGCFVRVV